MARHSKNNTAHSIFTYGERLKLKQLNEWGQVTGRIGTDSLKKFEQCSLCLSILSDPQTCPKGHLFCKACIIENLLFQKNEIKKRLIEWKNSTGSNKELERMNDQSDIFKKIENLRTAEEGVVNTAEEITLDYALMPKNDILRFEMINEFQKKKNLIFNRDKNELTRNCFWIPDLTPNCIVEEKGKPSEKTLCPVSNHKDHSLRLKDITPLKILRNENDDKYLCKICKKELSFQKIIALKKCGEVFCKKCFEITSKSSCVCPSCSKPYNDQDIIDLKESGSGYSYHNKVETMKLNPYFKC